VYDAMKVEEYILLKPSGMKGRSDAEIVASRAVVTR